MCCIGTTQCVGESLSSRRSLPAVDFDANYGPSPGSAGERERMITIRAQAVETSNNTFRGSQGEESSPEAATTLSSWPKHPGISQGEKQDQEKRKGG